ncbi:hypothetical protein [Oceanobacillus locisalsi]|uniref:Uncharacterized protein n=1 Tax=Oceanobacillus locisalsi TaxID=546107 RepID=A0ABW3NHK3_9BACI
MNVLVQTPETTFSMGRVSASPSQSHRDKYIPKYGLRFKRILLLLIKITALYRF